MTLAAVHEDDIRKDFECLITFHHPAESAGQHLPHGAVVVLTFYGPDPEFPVTLFIGFQPVKGDHGAHRIHAVGI